MTVPAPHIAENLSTLVLVQSADPFGSIITLLGALLGFGIVWGVKHHLDQATERAFRANFPQANPTEGTRVEKNARYHITLVVDAKPAIYHSNVQLTYRVQFLRPKDLGFEVRPLRADETLQPFELLNTRIIESQPYATFNYGWSGDYQRLLEPLIAHLDLLLPWVSFEITSEELIFRIPTRNEDGQGLTQTRIDADLTRIKTIAGSLLKPKPPLTVVQPFLAGEHSQETLAGMFRLVKNHYSPAKVTKTLGPMTPESDNLLVQMLRLYLGEPVNHETIGRFLARCDLDLRQTALDLLTQRPEFQLHQLIEVTRHQTSLFGWLLERLSQSDDRAAIPHLIALFHDPSFRTLKRADILIDIARDQDSRVQGFLCDILESGATAEQILAVRHLRDIGDRSCIAPLQQAKLRATGRLKHEITTTLATLSGRFPPPAHAGSLTPVNTPGIGSLSKAAQEPGDLAPISPRPPTEPSQQHPKPHT